VRRIAVLVVVTALGAAALTACGPPPPPEPLAPTPTSRALTVGHQQRVFVDTTRVMPGAEWLGARVLPTDLWYPTDRVHAPYPLVVFAHGYGVEPSAYAALLQRIAAAGYVVAAPRYPVLSGWPIGPSDVEDWDQHGADTSFVIDQMFAIAWFDPDLGPQLDMSRIALAGHSDGGVIAFQATFGEGHEDGRVRTAIVYSAALYDLGYRPNGRSLLHFLSQSDAFNPFDASVAYDGSIVDPRWTVALWGADHASPYFDPTNPDFDVVVGTTVNFLDVELKGASPGPFIVGVAWSGLAGFV
jgi:predicted esterase